MSGIAIIIQGADYSKKGLGKVTIKGTLPQPQQPINYLTIDQSFNSSNKVIINGDINGAVIQSIISKAHRYLVRKDNDKVAILQLQDSNSYIAIDGTDLTEYFNNIDTEDFGIFVKLPKFYYKVSQVEYEVWQIAISEERGGEDWQEWKGTDKLCGAFVTNKISNNYFKSLPLSTIAKTGDLKRDTFNTQCSMQGFSAYSLEWCNILKLLYLFKYGTFDIAQLGSCTNHFNGIKTGVTMSLGMTDTTSDSDCLNFMGIESLTFPTYVGNVFKIGSGNTYTNTDIQDQKFLYPLSSSSQYNDVSVPIKRLHIENLNFTPKEIDLNDPTNFDQYWCQGTSVYYDQGNYANQDWCYKACYRMQGNEIPQNGLFTIIPNLKTSANSEVCTRIVYNAEQGSDITEVKTFNEFKEF